MITPQELKNQIPLAALGRLSKNEEADLEAALADHPKLALELREHEDIITKLWHSAAPLQTIPRSAWDELRKELDQEISKTTRLPSSSKWLNRTGWAAALILGTLLIFQKRDAPFSASNPDAPLLHKENKSPTLDSLSKRVIPTDSRRQSRRDQINRLQRRLADALADRDSATLASQIIELRPPGDHSTSDPNTRSQRLLSLLAEALRIDLQKIDEETVTLIIEKGWLDFSRQTLPDDALVRHRAFPVDRFAKFNLLRSEKGYYYDPTSEFLWKPAPDGAGFVGSLAPDDLDLSNFEASPESQIAETQPATETRMVELSPAQGYLVRAEDGGSPTFVLNGVHPLFDAISVRQNGTSVPLDPTNALAFHNPLSTGGLTTSGASVGNRSIADAITRIEFPNPDTSQLGPQLMQVATSSGEIIQWNQSFEVVKTDLFGTETVILTSSP